MEDNHPIPKNRADAHEAASYIQSFKTDIGLPLVDPINEMTEILTKFNDRPYIKSLSPVELMEYSLLLGNYSLYLTMQENRLIAFINWCESNIKIIVGKNLNEVSGYFNEKDSYIRANEKTALELSDMKLVAQAKIDSIKWISTKIQHISDILDRLSHEKSKEKYSRSSI